jgi:endonuclease III
LTKIEPYITNNLRLPKHVKQVLEAFDELYPEPKCGLEESDPFGLLVATI